MGSRRSVPNAGTDKELVEDARRQKAKREKGYRAQALKVLPWVCAHCGRDFNDRNLHQLTVHHKDHNHDNNPQDGSNWELLCLYCHENEHSRRDVARSYSSGGSETHDDTSSGVNHPFAELDKLLKKSR